MSRRIWSVLWFIDDGLHRLRVPFVLFRPFCDWVDSRLWQESK